MKFIDEDSDRIPIADDLLCPVCKRLLHHPRYFPCGYTMYCECRNEKQLLCSDCQNIPSKNDDDEIDQEMQKDIDDLQDQCFRYQQRTPQTSKTSDQQMTREEPSDDHDEEEILHVSSMLSVFRPLHDILGALLMQNRELKEKIHQLERENRVQYESLNQKFSHQLDKNEQLQTSISQLEQQMFRQKTSNNSIEQDVFNQKGLINQLEQQLIKHETSINQLQTDVQIQRTESMQRDRDSTVVRTLTSQSTSSSDQLLCTPRTNPNRRWKQNGVIVAGGNDRGTNFNQLSGPYGFRVDDNQLLYIADAWNHRIISWKCHEDKGQMIVGATEQRDREKLLSLPTDLIIDKQTDSIIIADPGNRRVLRWSYQQSIVKEIILSDIDCRCLAMDNNGDLYVSDVKNHEVRRWKKGEQGSVRVAGGNGKGDDLNQLNAPTYLFVDEECSVYVSDMNNHRVMKWAKDANEGIVVAGGNGPGDSLRQLNYPCGVVVDHLNQIYVADMDNRRVVRWCKDANEGSIVVGGNRSEEQENLLGYPISLCFDSEDNLYVSEWNNHCIRKFEIDFN